MKRVEHVTATGAAVVAKEKAAAAALRRQAKERRKLHREHEQEKVRFETVFQELDDVDQLRAERVPSERLQKFVDTFKLKKRRLVMKRSMADTVTAMSFEFARPAPDVHEEEGAVKEKENVRNAPKDNDPILWFDVLHPSKDPARTQSFLVRRSQRISELVDLVACANDDRLHEHAKASKLVYFGQKFFVDRRVPGNVDYSEQIVRWIRAKPERVAKFGTFADGCRVAHSLHSSTFADLELHIDVPGVYIHQGECEHLLRLRDARLPHELDAPKSDGIFPLRLPNLLNRPLRNCLVCQHYTAKYVCYGDRLSMMDPMFFCNRCYRAAHYDSNGKLLYNDFLSFPDSTQLHLHFYTVFSLRELVMNAVIVIGGARSLGKFGQRQNPEAAGSAHHEHHVEVAVEHVELNFAQHLVDSLAALIEYTQEEQLEKKILIRDRVLVAVPSKHNVHGAHNHLVHAKRGHDVAEEVEHTSAQRARPQRSLLHIPVNISASSPLMYVVSSFADEKKLNALEKIDPVLRPPAIASSCRRADARSSSVSRFFLANSISRLWRSLFSRNSMSSSATRRQKNVMYSYGQLTAPKPDSSAMNTTPSRLTLLTKFRTENSAGSSNKRTMQHQHQHEKSPYLVFQGAYFSENCNVAPHLPPTVWAGLAPARRPASRSRRGTAAALRRPRRPPAAAPRRTPWPWRRTARAAAPAPPGTSWR
ncbi:hypothetical protein ON010_g12536 [Phytophthora cinnamomi]|nr:hypothetical protein ON010_g12536 [Phytophthora cinnamomi]